MTAVPGYRETKRCWELLMKKWRESFALYSKQWSQNFGTDNLQTQKFYNNLFPLVCWIRLDSSQFDPWLEANVDALSKNGSTPLLVASREGHTPVCKVFKINLESPLIDFF